MIRNHREALATLQAFEQKLEDVVEDLRSGDAQRIIAAKAAWEAAGKADSPCGTPGHHVEDLVAGRGFPVQCGACLKARALARDAAQGAAG